jgi:predicted patatin/cPLA2 family phospholipase
MLNEKVFPNVILSKISSEEKKEMFMQALKTNMENLQRSYEALVDFMIEKQSDYPEMKELYEKLETLVPKKEKK